MISIKSVIKWFVLEFVLYPCKIKLDKIFINISNVQFVTFMSIGIIALILVFVWEKTPFGKYIDTKINNLFRFILNDNFISVEEAAKILRVQTNLGDEDAFWAEAFKGQPIDYRIILGIEHLIILIKGGYLSLYGNRWPQKKREKVTSKDIKDGYFDSYKTKLFNDPELEIINFSNLEINEAELLQFFKAQKRLPDSERELHFYEN